MTGGNRLLLLTVFMLLKRCQQKPQVAMSPRLTAVFAGDLFYLNCDNSPAPVKWYINGKSGNLARTYKIAVAHPAHSGTYECEINQEKSDPFLIQVLDYEPSASLTIKTGHPVMQKGGSVMLNLHNDNGIQGWQCWVFTEGKVKRIVLRSTSETSLDFQSRRLETTETTFWCSHANKNIRSNQITVRISEKAVALEMYPLPAIAGESLTLRCLTWGTDLLSRAVFYKGNDIISTGASDTYSITNMTKAKEGKYKCDATYAYVPNAAGPPYQQDSDAQDILVQEPPMKAVLSEGMYCSCQHCPSDSKSHWYMRDGQAWVYVGSTAGTMAPDRSGIYACREVWDSGRSSLSSALKYEPQQSSRLLFLFILLVIVVLVAVVICIWCKKRNTAEPIYEDVAMWPRGKVDEKEVPNEYEGLKKEGMKEGAYHTLRTKGAAGAAGGYEALKKEGMKEGVYHSLGTEDAAGAAGGYEALKKEGMKEGVYHSLGTEDAAGDGGYEEGGGDKNE